MKSLINAARNWRKIGALLACILLLATGCAPRNLGEIYGDEASAPVAAQQTRQPPQAAGRETKESLTHDAQPSPTPAPTRAAVQQTAAPFQAADRATENIRAIDVFLDGTMAMMGFADLPSTLLNVYAKVVSLAEQRGVYTDAEVNCYRVGTDTPYLLSQSSSSSAPLSPSFYVERTMRSLPSGLVLEDGTEPRGEQRMVRFLPGFYASAGLQEPEGAQTTSPVAAALKAWNSLGSDDHLAVIVSDFSELQQSDAALLTLLTDAFKTGKTAAFVAVRCSFSGLVPQYGANVRWRQWGSLPSGSKTDEYSYQYDYTDKKTGDKTHVAYTLPVSESDDERFEKAETRPVYLLLIGKTSQLDAHVRKLTDSLKSSFSYVECAYQIFENDYSNPAYTLEGNVRPVEQTREANVRYAQNTAPGSAPFFFEMGQPRDKSDDERSALFSIALVPKTANPQIGRFSTSSYRAALSVAPLTEDGKPGEALQLDSRVCAIVESASPDGSSITLRARHPYKALPKGSYRVTVRLQEKNPGSEMGLERFESYSILQSDAGVSSFNGARTYGLQGFLEAMSQGQSDQRDSWFDLGSFEYDILIND